MTARHASIITELYAIDPSLREHETELVALVEKLLERDPVQTPSAAFVKKLRKELALRAKTAENVAVEHRVSFTAPSGFFGRFAYALAGATAAVIVAVPVTLQWSQRDSVPVPPDSEKIAAMPETDQAMGITTAPPSGSNPVPTATFSRGQGGGGGDAFAQGKMSAIASMVEPWNPVRYRFDGDLPVLPDSEVEVLERNLRPLNVAFSRIGEAFKDAAIDVSSFDDPSVDTITATQRTPFGYTITISLQDGSVSLNQAWEFWPHPENDCRDDACFKRYQTKLSNIPADAELIRIASAFLAEHDIDVSTYGTPIVDNAWRREYDRTSDKNTAWVPDTLRVVYPLLVDGKTVMDIGGGPSGVSVQVSVRHKRVSDVWGLSTYQFTRSKHPAISDRHDIDDFLGHAGSQTPNAPVVTLKDPSIGFIRVYTYDAGKNVELFVPALIFRITDVPNDVYVYQQTVAVPLAKDLFDEATSSMPMPLDGGPAIDIPSQDPTPIENATR